MQLFKYSTVTPWLKHPINAYLIVLPNGEALLIDTGVDIVEAYEALETTIWKAGIGWNDIRYILLTHGHPDHYGMTARILEHTNAAVLINSADQPKVTSGPENLTEWRQRMTDFLIEHGLSDDEAESIRHSPNTWGRYARSIPENAIQPLLAPSRLEFPGLTLEVIPTPGHSLGSCCFYSSDYDVLFSGDSLLPDITPNPVVEFGAGEQQIYQSLIQMRESLLTIRRISPERVLPGHGETAFNPIALIDRQFKYISARSERIMTILGDQPLNVLELAVLLFRGARGPDKLLAISEVLGHLGWLELKGRVRRQEIAGVVQWDKVRDNG